MACCPAQPSPRTMLEFCSPSGIHLPQHRCTIVYSNTALATRQWQCRIAHFDGIEFLISPSRLPTYSPRPSSNDALCFKSVSRCGKICLTRGKLSRDQLDRTVLLEDLARTRQRQSAGISDRCRSGLLDDVSHQSSNPWGSSSHGLQIQGRSDWPCLKDRRSIRENTAPFPATVVVQWPSYGPRWAVSAGRLWVAICSEDTVYWKRSIRSDLVHLLSASSKNDPPPSVEWSTAKGELFKI